MNHLHQKGETWNESRVYKDSWTLRSVRQITSKRQFNQMPNYHTGSAFSADGEFMIFSSITNGKTAVFICHVPSGDITQLTDWHPGIDVEGVCIVPNRKYVLYVRERSLVRVNYETLDEVELIPASDVYCKIRGGPSVDKNEMYVVLPVSTEFKREADDRLSNQGLSTKLLQVPLHGGKIETVYEQDDETCTHSTHNPADPDLLLFNRDYADCWDGKQWNFGRRSNRVWMLEIPTGKLTELPPRDEAKFQVHSVWTWDGSKVIYHGGNGKNGGYIGVIEKNGETVREYGYQHTPGFYGHVAAMPGRPAIILDGNLSNDLLLWMYYDRDAPRVEVIAYHGTDWKMGGQSVHPHPQTDRGGKRLVFNSASEGRSDVFIVDL